MEQAFFTVPGERLYRKMRSSAYDPLSFDAPLQLIHIGPRVKRGKMVNVQAPP